jgi:hypothetical protein
LSFEDCSVVSYPKPETETVIFEKVARQLGLIE